MDNINSFIDNFERSIDFDPSLGFKFFLSFARFEYALKEAGFLKNKDYASPNWLAYAESVEEYMVERNEIINESLEYFINNPTKIQKNSNGSVEYVETPYDNNYTPFVWAIMMIKRVRNNFFHGGKYRDLVVVDSLRNTIS